MKYFQKIAEGLDVLPILHAAHRQPELWNANTIRTKHPGTAHSEVSDILLRFNEVPEAVAFSQGVATFESPAASVINDKECGPLPAWHLLPQVRPIIFALMRLVEGTRLGRVIITKLPPGKQIAPHVDGGAPATYYDRYQVALQSQPGCVFKIGDEQIVFRTGEVWWIDNCVEHSVLNNSQDDRIVMIVDIRTK